MSSNTPKLTVDLSLCEGKLPSTRSTLEEILKCPQLQQFVDAYNARMREQSEDWEDLPVNALTENTEMAMAIGKMWEEETIFNNSSSMDIQVMSDLIRHKVGKVRDADLTRVVDKQELYDRLLAQEFNIFDIHAACEEMYIDLGYAKALEEKGMIESEDSYELPFPALTEAQVQDLEDDLIANKIDTIFIDDRRLNAVETAQAFGIDIDDVELLKNSSPLANATLKDLQNMGTRAKDVKERIKEAVKSGETDEAEVRLVAFKASRKVKDLDPGESFVKGSRHKGEMVPLDAATNMRLGVYLASSDAELRGKFHFGEVRNLHSTDEVPLEVIVNQATPEGEMLTMTVKGLDWDSQEYTVSTIGACTKKRRTIPVMVYSFSFE